MWSAVITLMWCRVERSFTVRRIALSWTTPSWRKFVLILLILNALLLETLYAPLDINFEVQR